MSEVSSRIEHNAMAHEMAKSEDPFREMASKFPEGDSIRKNFEEGADVAAEKAQEKFKEKEALKRGSKEKFMKGLTEAMMRGEDVKILLGSKDHKDSEAFSEVIEEMMNALGAEEVDEGRYNIKPKTAEGKQMHLEHDRTGIEQAEGGGLLHEFKFGVGAVEKGK